MAGPLTASPTPTPALSAYRVSSSTRPLTSGRGRQCEICSASRSTPEPRGGPVGTGVLIAQPYIGTKLAEFGAEVIHVERAGGDTFRTTAPFITRGPRPHGADEAEVAKNMLSMGLDLERVKGVELLMALWKISDVWMESSAPGTLVRRHPHDHQSRIVDPTFTPWLYSGEVGASSVLRICLFIRRLRVSQTRRDDGETDPQRQRGTAHRTRR